MVSDGLATNWHRFRRRFVVSISTGVYISQNVLHILTLFITVVYDVGQFDVPDTQPFLLSNPGLPGRVFCDNGGEAVFGEVLKNKQHVCLLNYCRLNYINGLL